MLISAVADRIAHRVAALVYLDAFVPRDGDSAYTTTNDDQRRWYIEGAADTGLAVAPLPFFDDRARPHPLATLTQRLDLTGAWETVPVKHYVEALQWPAESPLAPTIKRIRAAPGWTLHRWNTRHNVMHDGPDCVLDLLIDIPVRLESGRATTPATTARSSPIPTARASRSSSTAADASAREE